MGFSAANYSGMFDNINELTTKKDIVRELKRQTGKKKEYLESLFDISKVYKGMRIWFLYDLETFFNRKLNVLPFFRPEFFIGGWDWSRLEQGNLREGFETNNCYHYENETIMYVSACGLKKMLLILALGESVKD